MLLQKVQDNIPVLNNLNNGDILINSESELVDDVQITPRNIYWVDYSDHYGVSLKSFDKGEKFVSYEELRSGHYWYILLLSLYLK